MYRVGITQYKYPVIPRQFSDPFDTFRRNGPQHGIPGIIQFYRIDVFSGHLTQEFSELVFVNAAEFIVQEKAMAMKIV